MYSTVDGLGVTAPLTAEVEYLIPMMYVPAELALNVTVKSPPLFVSEIV